MILVREIKVAVAQEFGISRHDLESFTRRYDYSRPRQLAMALSACLTRHSNARIGAFFARDATTVRHAKTAVNSRLRSDPVLRARTRRVLRQLRSGR